MASVRIYCDCKVQEIGTATLDMYKLPLKYIETLWVRAREQPCKHCGQPLKHVGDRGCLSERQANKIDSRLEELHAEVPKKAVSG